MSSFLTLTQDCSEYSIIIEFIITILKALVDKLVRIGLIFVRVLTFKPKTIIESYFMFVKLVVVADSRVFNQHGFISLLDHVI